MVTIRPARAEELEALRAIELAAGRAFAAIGMPEVADDEPPPVPTLRAYVDRGRAWVAAEPVEDAAVGYVLVDLVDGAAHVEQVSVHPARARERIGRRLLEHVASWAIDHGHVAMTLTTFREVAWNAPYYRRCGFRDLADDELGPQLRDVMAAEAAHGLDPARRVAMVRALV
ncbi:MAG: GNAT family N-acetyltransferase [Acidimicrobiales bacterium]|nr:GNAT family N-acetyltransferase [Acidimicrobiales bacterium]